MFGRKAGFLKDLRNLRAAYVKPDVFPWLIFISLVESSCVIGYKENLVFMDIILPVVDAQYSLTFKYYVQDYKYRARKPLPMKSIVG